MKRDHASWKFTAAGMLVAGLLMALSATAQTKFRLNNRDRSDIQTLKRGNTTMVPARPFFREFGADLSVQDKVYRVQRGADRYRFRHGTNVYYYNDQRRYFPGAPYVYGGRLYVPPEPFLNDWGWRTRYYGDRYEVSHPTYWMGPGELRLTSPREGATVRDNEVFVAGYASPLRDLRILLYYYPEGDRRGGRLVYETPLRSESSGRYDVRLPVDRDGRYRVIVQLLNDAGGIAAEEINWFTAT